MAHRAQIRANLAGDPEWISDYVTHLTPMLQEQENSIVSQPHWASELAAPTDGDGHFYVMEVLQEIGFFSHFQIFRLSYMW